MKHKQLIIALSALVLGIPPDVNANGIAGAKRTETNQEGSATGHPGPTNKSGFGTNQFGVITKISPAPASNGYTAVVPETVIWQFGAPTSRTNKFNPILPTNLPPAAEQTGEATNHLNRGTNSGASLLPANGGNGGQGTNGVVAVLPEPVVWQFGAPTSRSNKFNPVLPTNLPPAAPK